MKAAIRLLFLFFLLFYDPAPIRCLWKISLTKGKTEVWDMGGLGFREIRQLDLTAPIGRLLMRYWTRLRICKRQDSHPSSRPPHESQHGRHTQDANLPFTPKDTEARGSRLHGALRGASKLGVTAGAGKWISHIYASWGCDQGKTKETNKQTIRRRKLKELE